MFRKLLVLIPFLLLSLCLSAEDFDITAYDVNVGINSDGSLDIIETIDLYYHVQKHGLMREIPFRYNYDQKRETEEPAKRDETPHFYEILIKDVSVDGFEHEAYKEGDMYVIKIGSADTYIEGPQRMVIRYKVWGALNRFSEHTEFYWNLIGHDWDLPVPNVSFSVSMPDGFTPRKDDILLFFGAAGSKDQITDYSLFRNQISGKWAGPLKAKEGITLAIRFPSGLFSSTSIPLTELAEKFFVRNSDISVHIRKDGVLKVRESHDIVFLKPSYGFWKDFKIKGFSDLSVEEDYQDFFILNHTVSMDSDPGRRINSSLYGYGQDKRMNVSPDTGRFRDSIRITFAYEVTGAVKKTGNSGIHCKLGGGFFGEPVGKVSFSLTADSGMTIYPEALLFYENDMTFFKLPCRRDAATSSVKGELGHTLSGDNAFHLFISMDKEQAGNFRLPPICLARYYYVKKIICRIGIEKNGMINIRKDYDVLYLNSPGLYGKVEFSLARVYNERQPLPYNIAMLIPDWSWIGRYSKLLMTEPLPGGENWDWNYTIKRRSYDMSFEPRNFEQKETIFSTQYSVFGLLRKEGNFYILNFPVGEFLSEPVGSCDFEVILPEGGSLLKLEGKYYYDNGEKQVPMPLRISGRRVTGESNMAYTRGVMPMLWLKIPAEVMDISGGLTFRTFWINNHPIVLSLILFIILLVLWFFFGRDRRSTLVVAYKPPADISPAEAGYLWDFKIHKRDLVSLIWYWAGLGLISIEESGTETKPDYTLHKLADLPEGSRDFEKTMFKGLFGSGSSCKVSDKRNSFYTTMSTAGDQLTKHGRTSTWFLHGSRKLGILMQVISWGLIIYGSIHILAASFNNLQVMTGYLFSFAILQFFGRVMPKRAPFGNQKYNELRGFREFIQRAEKEKLQDLLKENPSYYDETLAYAIVLGLGHVWAERFNELITAPPSYYKGSQSTFSTSLMMNQMLKSMHKMEEDFHYRYVPPSKSRSSFFSSSSSSSGSSYSYRSSGGSGSSSFGGGGHSGGGYGGGGGKSW